jgi:hypothetical protein
VPKRKKEDALLKLSSVEEELEQALEEVFEIYFI